MMLYTYFRSSAAYRLRIAFNLKGLSPQQRSIHLVKDGGQQHSPEFRALNPQGLVPALTVDGPEGTVTLGQSVAIAEYLDEAHPEPPLLPGDALTRARIRAFALTIACDIHPLNNLRVLQYLKRALGQEQAAIDAWARTWITAGFQALEAMAATTAGRFCFGDAPTLADVCLVPQMYNARRVATDLEPFPLLRRIEAACLDIPAFADAHPDRQPDAA